MRKKIALWMTLVMVLTLLPMGSFADEHQSSEALDSSVAFTLGEAGYWMGETWVESDATPYIQADRIMVPVAHASRALGAEVLWKAETKEVEVKHHEDTYTLTIGSTKLQKNGEALEEMDTVPVIQNIGNGLGRTMLPVSRLAKVLNVAYTWDAETKTATFMPMAEEGPVVYDEAGTYGPEEGEETIDNDVIISADGVILQNMIITGTLTITEGVGDGDVTLNNITVEGDTLIQGGGTDSIHINGGSYNNIIVQRTPTGAVRVVVTGQNRLNIEVDEDAAEQILILEGFYDKVIITAPNVRIITRGETQINELIITGAAKNTTLETSDDTTIEKAVVDGEGTVFEGGTGTVKELEGDEKDDLEDKDDVVVKQPARRSSGGGTPSNDNDDEGVAVSSITNAEVDITSGSIIFGYTFYDGDNAVTYLEATQDPYYLDALHSHVELISGEDKAVQHFQQLNVSDNGQVVYADSNDIIASWWSDPTEAFVPAQIRIYLTPTDQGEWDAFEVVRDLTAGEKGLFMPPSVELPLITGTAVITGDAVYGEMLGVEITIIGEHGSVEWRRDGVVIPGKTSGDYTIVEEDIGKQLTFAVIGDGILFGGTIVSEPTAVVTKAHRGYVPDIPVESEVGTTFIKVVEEGLIEYRLDEGPWQTAGHFTGLSANTTYSIEARYVETSRYFASGSSLPLNRTTLSAHIGEFAGGDGTAGNPYKVDTAQHLDNIRNHLDKHFIQTSNIDLDVSPWNVEEGWLPIMAFEGSYDGNDKIISNIRINRPTENDVGLFGTLLADALIQDLNMVNVNISGDSSVGSVLGRNQGGILRNISATGTVNAKSNYAGGLVGNFQNGLVEQCHAKVDVTGIGHTVGGLIGFLLGDVEGSYATGEVKGDNRVGGLVGDFPNGRISTSYASGDVSGIKSTSDAIGGLVGRTRDASKPTDTLIEKSYAIGSVTGNVAVGGLVANNHGSINKSYSIGIVTGTGLVGGLVGTNSGSINKAYSIGIVTGTRDTGGLVGTANSGASVSNSFWNKETSNQSTSAGGDGKTTVEMKEQSTYTGWNFTDIWTRQEGQSYPYFKWQNDENIPYLPSEFAGGEGTAVKPYQVETATHLNNVRNHLDKHFIQIADIDLGVAPWNVDEGWEPIGKQLDTFRGIYDGNGYTVSNLSINPSLGSMDSGLFGYSQGVISSCSVTGIVNGYEQTGFLVGRNDGSIINCSAIGEVSGTNTVGGLVGSNLTFGVIAGSYSEVKVSSSGDNVGGFAGLNAGKIEDCHSKGEVQGIRRVGGLVGANTGDIDESFSSGKVTGDTTNSDTNSGGLVGVNSGSIQNSYSLGNVVGYRYVGGLVGGNRFGISNDGNITNSYSTGTVTGTAGVGGLIGYYPGIVTSSYWDTVSSGISTSAGGDGKTTVEMKEQSTYTGWNFPDTWTINPKENDGYPALQWQEFAPSPASVGSAQTVTEQVYEEDEISMSFNFSGAFEDFSDNMDESKSDDPIDMIQIDVTILPAILVQYRKLI